MKISVQAEDFDLSAEVIEISANPRTGAVASFVGQVREVPMTLEHYPGMTENAIRQIVLVAIASSHRADAFAACQFIMDYLKTQAPFWKKEHHPDGSRWVDARDSDDQAAERWRSLRQQQRLSKP